MTKTIARVLIDWKPVYIYAEKSVDGYRIKKDEGCPLTLFSGFALYRTLNEAREAVRHMYAANGIEPQNGFVDI